MKKTRKYAIKTCKKWKNLIIDDDIIDAKKRRVDKAMNIIDDNLHQDGTDSGLILVEECIKHYAIKWDCKNGCNA